MMEITFFSYNVWPPTYVSWFINPMNILVLRFKYHKHSQTIVIGVLLNQLRYRLGGPLRCEVRSKGNVVY